MWTRKDIDEFKANLLREGGEAIIKVNHGETVTVIILIAIQIHFSILLYKIICYFSKYVTILKTD